MPRGIVVLRECFLDYWMKIVDHVLRRSKDALSRCLGGQSHTQMLVKVSLLIMERGEGASIFEGNLMLIAI